MYRVAGLIACFVHHIQSAGQLVIIYLVHTMHYWMALMFYLKLDGRGRGLNRSFHEGMTDIPNVKMQWK